MNKTRIQRFGVAALLVGGLLASVLCVPTYAAPDISVTSSGYVPTNWLTPAMSVTPSSSRVALPLSVTTNIIVVANKGTANAYVALGGASVTAAVTNDVIFPGSAQVFVVNNNTYLAAIADGGTSTTLNISAGYGTPAGLGTGSVVSASLIGSASNASSVATSATSVPTIAYNYGFNGVTWDQLQVDANKQLKVVSSAVGAGSIATAQVSVGVAPATLVAAARTGAPGTGRISVVLYNAGSVPVCFGPLGVTTSTGVCVAAGASVPWPTTAAIYGVSGSPAQNVNVLELY